MIARDQGVVFRRFQNRLEDVARDVSVTQKEQGTGVGQTSVASHQAQ
jgi:hypothetical protein